MRAHMLAHPAQLHTHTHTPSPLLPRNRYLLYLRPADVQPFLEVPNLAKWVRQGRVVIIEWDAVDEHIGLPAWDQRLVYNHAVLAFLGRPAYLFMPDIDEYLVPTRPGLESFFDMARECFPANNSPEQAGGFGLVWSAAHTPNSLRGGWVTRLHPFHTCCGLLRLIGLSPFDLRPEAWNPKPSGPH